MATFVQHLIFINIGIFKLNILFITLRNISILYVNSIIIINYLKYVLLYLKNYFLISRHHVVGSNNIEDTEMADIGPLFNF